MESKYDDDDHYESKQEKGEGKQQEELDSHGRVKDKRGRISDDELLQRVQRYFFEDESFTRTFESFVDVESAVIDIRSEEYKLEYTDIYEKFKALFENTLEKFITNQGCTIHDFYNAMRNKQEADPDGSLALFGQILISVTDFHVFMTMMRESAKAKSHK